MAQHLQVKGVAIGSKKEPSLFPLWLNFGALQGCLTVVVHSNLGFNQQETRVITSSL